jgi:hypothetical protein
VGNQEVQNGSNVKRIGGAVLPLVAGALELALPNGRRR